MSWLRAVLADRARRLVFVFAGLVFAFHLAFAARYGWFRDELYYVACARRLDWGYVDHPPTVAVIARLSLALFGDSLVGLRSFAALAGAATVVLSAEIARTLGASRYGQMLAAFATAIAPYDLVVAQIYTMNAFEPLAWSGVTLLVLRALHPNRPEGFERELLWLGPIAALGVLDKYSAGWHVAGLLIGVAVTRPRELWRWQLGASALFGGVMLVPHVIWQLRHGLPTREFAANALAKNEPYGPLGLFEQELLLTQPILALLWILGLGGLLFARSLRPYRALGVAALAVTALVFATQAKAYYLGPAFPALFAAGAAFLESITERRARAARYVFPAISGAVALALMPMAVPVLDVRTFQRYSASLGGFGEAKSGERFERAALPQLYADMFGWRELAIAVDNAALGLPSGEREGALVLARNYGEASAIEHFARGPLRARVASGDNGWWLWGPPATEWPETTLLVGYSREEAERWFDDVQLIARVDHSLAREDERHLPIWACRGPRASLAEAWPSLKHYK
ncbi:MAG: glycosyltransferase family 39 protein [Polyangiaceae bacterium]